LRLFTASIAMLRRCYAAALLTRGIALLPGLLRILLLLMLRVLSTLLTALLTTAWVVFMRTLSELRALLIGHLKPPGIFIPSGKLGSGSRSKVAPHQVDTRPIGVRSAAWQSWRSISRRRL
jgi:hypothetical protein